MKSYAIASRARHTDPLKIIEQTNSLEGATEFANALYNTECLDKVMVLNVTTDPLSKKPRLDKVYSCERRCKHPNVQMDFLEGNQYKCIDCGQTIRSSKVIQGHLWGNPHHNSITTNSKFE